jgi:hypothetical protein
MGSFQIKVEQVKIGPNAGKWSVVSLINNIPCILTMKGFKLRTSPIQPDGIMLWNEEEGAKNAVTKYCEEMFK